MIVPKMKALIISGDQFTPPDYVIKTTKGVLFYRIAMPISMSDQVAFGQSLEKRTVGRAITFADIHRFKKEIADYFKRYCNLHVAVVLPEQDCTNGVIVLKVTESKVGDVSVTGNYWFTKEHYLRYVKLHHNDTLDSNKMVASLNKINSNPWTKAEVVYKPGQNPGETDIELVVKDRKPMQFYAGSDNTGFAETEYSRLYVGFNWGNILDMDQTLAFCYTSSPDFKGYQSYVVDYQAPLPNDDKIRAMVGYAHVQAEAPDIAASVRDGNSWEVSGRYGFHLPQSLQMKQDAQLGFDYKSTNNDLIVGETSISSHTANIFQIVGHYEGEYHTNPHHVSGQAKVCTQPWSFGSSMSKARYSFLRPNSTPYYIFARGDVKYLWDTGKPNDYTASIRMMGQLSSSALIPIEQFGLGGINSVRGYVSREVNVDEALVFNIDLMTPKVSLLRQMKEKYRHIDRLSGVLFLDMASGWLLKTVPRQDSYYFLAGIGPGIRYDLWNNIYTRFDLGVRLTRPPFGATYLDRVRFYFSVIGTY